MSTKKSPLTDQIIELQNQLIEALKENARLREENERLKRPAELPPITVPAPHTPSWPSTPPWLPADPSRPWWDQPWMVVPCSIKQTKDSGV